MIRVTWEWLGQAPALDVANTITVEAGSDRDLWSLPGRYVSWAAVEAAALGLPADDAAALRDAEDDMRAICTPVRDAIAAHARELGVPRTTIEALNRASSESPAWLELDIDGRSLVTRRAGDAAQQLAALYAQSALELIVDRDAVVRACPAPSCGMLFQPGRTDQRWCSRQCGTRARVTRHLQRARES